MLSRFARASKAAVRAQRLAPAVSAVPGTGGSSGSGKSGAAGAAAAFTSAVAVGVVVAASEGDDSETRRVECPKFDVRPSVLFVLGGPGAGKGTQCERLVKECGFVHLSAGDLLRAERKSGSKDGDLIARYILEGNIVPVEITVGLLAKAMAASGKSKFLIDGFPRNDNNLAGWRNVMGDNVDVEGVLFYDVDDATRLERLLERGKTSGRTDDNAEVIQKRFAVFKKQTMPVVQHYDRQGRVFRIDGAPPPDEVFRATVRAVSPVLEKEVLGAVSRLLDSVDRLDWPAYEALCDEGMTAIEDESGGALVRGLDFHKFYFDQARRDGAAPSGRRSAMLSPSVELLGLDTAVVTYTRAVQSLEGSDVFAETRVMRRGDGGWRCVHFHRSAVERAGAGDAEGGEGFADDVTREVLESLDASAREAKESMGAAIRELREASRA